MKSFKKLYILICIAVLCLPSLSACGRAAQVSTPAPGQAQPSPNQVPPLTTDAPVLIATAPSVAESVLPAGDTTQSITYAGIERSYILHVPPGIDAVQKIPLVLAFHGIGLDANEMMRISGLNAQADVSGFVVAYPNGTGENKSWNGGHCCGEAAKNNVDDIGFVRALVEDLSTSYNLDSKRIYVTGFSNGAIFAYRIACELADLVAAVAPLSATQILEDMQACQPARALPLIHFHGTADQPNPYDGGETLAGYQFIPVSTAIQFWVEKNGCPTQPQTSQMGSIRHDLYSPCSAGADVELYTIVDGMHAWPGGEAVNQKMGEPTDEISASALIWEFFVSHPMP